MSEPLTRTDIVEAALGLLAGGGLHALAMRRIAAELGIQQSALYWHFDNKQQLLSAVADQIVAPVHPVEQGSWSSRIIALSARLRRALLAYPDGAELVAAAIAFRLGAQRPFQLFAGILADAGLGRDDAEIAASVLVHFTLGFTADEQQHHQAAALGAIMPDPADPSSADDRFGRGVNLIVLGLTSQLA
ncbi:MAG TPA: TetR family transcriptional regulator [Ilumatobacteraceae bacterium]|nr:TetR family transcriptional regulator [Ilumatobacteraceae bacterium]